MGHRLHANALLLMLIAGLVFGLFGAPSAAAKADPAAKSYGGCLNGQKRGDLLLLLDESGSLKTSDPQGARVSAGQYFIGLLAGLASRESIDLSVSVAGFSDDYHPALDWTRLDRDGARRVNSTLEEFRSRNQGVQTDYWNGLNGARSALNRRSQGDPGRCQALVWFSDGKFDVWLTEAQWEANEGARTKRYAPKNLDLRDRRDAERAKQAAEKDMCRGGGLADQLRIGKISMFAIGLTSREASASDFDTMRKVATGSDNCGKRREPPGSFTTAGDIDALYFALEGSIIPGDPGTQPICQRPNPQACRKLGHSIVLDNSVSSVHILASSDITNAEVYLFYPGDSNSRPVQLTRKPIVLRPPGSQYSWLTDRTLSIDLVNRNRNARPWIGQWTLVFLDRTASSQGKKSIVKISVQGDLYPAWPAAAATPLRTGEVISGVKFGLGDDQGKPVDPTQLKGTGTFNAELVKADGSKVPVASGLELKQVSTKEHTLDLTGVPPGRAELQMSLEVTTASFGKIPGTKLEPRTVTVPLEILPPLGTPQLATQVNFGSVTGAAKEQPATLGVTGPGCVWLPSSSVPDVQTSPEGLGALTITSPTNEAETCLRVEEGQQADLALQLSTEEGGNGTLAGTFPVTVTPLDRPDKTATVPVPFTADLHKPLNPVNFWLTLIAALILGPAIPLLLLALVKRITATIPGQPLLARKIPVTIRGGEVLREGQPLVLRDTDFRDLVPLKTKGSRTAEIPGGTLRTKTGWSPFGAGYVEADLPGQVALSSTHPRPWGRNQVARLPLAVHNTWIAARSPADPPDAATLVVLAGLDATGSHRQGLLNDVRARLPGLMPLLGAPTDGDGAQPADPFASPGPHSPAAGPDVFGFGGGHPAEGSADPFASAWGRSAPTMTPAGGRDAGPVDPFAPTSAAPPSAGPPPPDAGPSEGRPPEQAAPTQEWSFDAGFDDPDTGPGRY